MKTRAHNPGPVPAHNPSGDKDCRYPVARGIFCGIFKRAKRCKRPCKKRRANPDQDTTYVVYDKASRPAPTSGPLGTRRANPSPNPADNPCSTCGFGVPPNPPGNASSRQRWAWAMSQVGRPIVNPGPCPDCGRHHNPQANPGPQCPGQIRCADGRCVDSVAECDLPSGGITAGSTGLSGRPGMGLAMGGAPSTGAQMLMGRRQRRAAKHQLALSGAVANPERVRNLSVGPTLLALQASHFVPAARPQQQQSINYPPIPVANPQSNPRLSARGGGFQPYWSIGGQGPWYWRTRSTPAAGYPAAVGWGAPPSVGVTPAWGPAPWGSFQYQGGFWPWNGTAPYPGRYRNAADAPAQNPGVLATTFLVAGAAIAGGLAGAGAVGYAACQPRQWHDYQLQASGRDLRIHVIEYPCAQDGLPYEVTVYEYFGKDEPELSFGPQKTETYEGAIAWAAEQSAFDWSSALAEFARRTDQGLKGAPQNGAQNGAQNGVAQNPRGYLTIDLQPAMAARRRRTQNATLLFPAMEISRAPKTRLRNPGIAQARARLNNPPIYPGPGALSGPLPPQWFYYQSPSTAGAPAAPGISVAAPGPPPGVFGLGAVCYNDRDCRDDEYCHGGACVRSPWDTGAGPTPPGKKLGNPGHVQAMTVPLAPGIAVR